MAVRSVLSGIRTQNMVWLTAQSGFGCLKTYRVCRLTHSAAGEHAGQAERSTDPSHLSHFHDPRFHEAMAKIMRFRQEYIEDRVLFVNGVELEQILTSLGARREDLPKLQSLSEGLGLDPTLPFRRIRNGRFCIDFDKKSVNRLEHRPFVLSVDEDFVRFDSGQVREFAELHDDVQNNTVFQALLLFKAMIINGVSVKPRELIDYSQNKFLCRAFHIRTITTPQVLGAPSSEGVHSDGADHVMATFLDSRNTTTDSAATYVHAKKETSGIQLDKANPLFILGRIRHQNPLDTLLIIDHERKHSNSPVYALDKSKEATRDMLIFFTRRPCMEGHISGSIDTLRFHERLGVQDLFRLPV